MSKSSSYGTSQRVAKSLAGSANRRNRHDGRTSKPRAQTPPATRQIDEENIAGWRRGDHAPISRVDKEIAAKAHGATEVKVVTVAITVVPRKR